MNEPRHDLLTEHFLAAAALDGAERHDYLVELSRREPGLVDGIESLLRHDASIPSLLEPGALVDLGDCPLRPGDRVGPYHLIEVLGAGGMGIVFRAEQREPIRREVAVKLIRGGFPTNPMVARFEAERQVLERIEHPHVARLLDAGTTAEGHRYVVMEYVHGEPITRFCDRERLELTHRLRLFVQVCAAIHHAHQNAILHRDLKPSNILVATIGDHIVPKIIDFGIAKILIADPSRDSTLTDASVFIGTPAYMSPEQATPGRRDIDIRSDIYSLGAVLYEILVGRPPLESKEGGVEGLRRILLEEEPLAPSRHLESRCADPELVALARGLGSAALKRRLRGDLDSIALKALSKDRTRRYGTAAELAADIERHLNSEPIAARPASRLYRLGKLVRKHRTASAVILALVPMLIVFATAMAIDAQRLARERDRAEDLSQFMVRLYDMPFFIEGRHGPRSAAEVLRRGAEKVEHQLDDRPVLQARLLHAVGVALRGIGDSIPAEPLLEEAHRRLQFLLGPEDPLTLIAASDLARCVADNGRYEQAERQFVEALDTQRRRLGPDHLDTLRTARDLGFIEKRLGRNAAAAPLLEQAHAGFLTRLGIADQETAVTASLLGSVDLDLRRLYDAERFIREALDHFEPSSPEKSLALYNLACVQAIRGNRAAALQGLQDSLAAGFVMTYFADPNLSSLFDDPEFKAIAKAAFLHASGVQYELIDQASDDVARGHPEDAATLYRYAMSALSSTGDAKIRMIRLNFARFYFDRGQFEEALPYLQADMAWRRSERQPNDGAVLQGLIYLGQAQIGSGRRDEALQTVKEMIEIAERDRGLGGPSWRHYSRACAAAIEGRPEVELRELQAAVASGFSVVGFVRDAPAFATLRARPEFTSLVRLLEDRFEFRASGSLPLPPSYRRVKN
jgi:eukaryotic-like serine/threonine-protein kinase